MTGAAKRKGDRAELEAARILADLLGIQVRRQLGAGRADDTGDIQLPDCIIQVASWADVSAAARLKPIGAERQRANAAVPHAATMVRFRGGTWRVVLTVEQWAALYREATS